MGRQGMPAAASKRASCCHPCDGKQLLVQEASLDQFEVAILDIMRLYFQSFAKPTSQSWINALRVATTYLRGEAAPVLAFQILAMVQAMRRSGSSVFVFSNPFCRHCAKILSDDVRHLVAAIHCVRANRRNEAQTHAMLLCQGNPTGSFLLAVDARCDGDPQDTMRCEPVGG